MIFDINTTDMFGFRLRTKPNELKVYMASTRLALTVVFKIP